MTFILPNQFKILSFAPRELLDARHALEKMRRFLLGLEKISPWRRPFDVGASTVKHSYMPIQSDLSDFADVSMLALSDYNELAYRNPDPNNKEIGSNSLSPHGFGLWFSDYVSKKEHAAEIRVRLRTTGFSDVVDASLAHIEIPKFLPGEMNAAWCEKDVVLSIMEFICEFNRPTVCVAGTVNQKLSVFSDVNYHLGWLTYTRDPAFIAALAGDPHVTPFRDGILITVGDGVSTLEAPENLRQLAELRDKLTVAGVTKWSFDL